MAKKVKRIWQQKLADGFCKHMNAKEEAMAKKVKQMKALKPVKVKAFAVWNVDTQELLGAHPNEDRVKEVWCMSRGRTVYAPCVVILPPVETNGRNPRILPLSQHSANRKRLGVKAGKANE